MQATDPGRVIAAPQEQAGGPGHGSRVERIAPATDGKLAGLAVELASNAPSDEIDNSASKRAARRSRR